MKGRAVWMLGLAVVLAGASVFLARNWIEERTRPVIVEQTPVDTSTAIVVAANRFEFGNKIRSEHLRLVKWPVDSVPEGAFTSIQDVVGESEDRIALQTIEANEPLLETKITGFGGRASLSTVLAPDMRAVTIRVNDVHGVAGFVLPGDRVDVLLTRDPNGGAGDPAKDLITDVLLQNTKVLGIDQNANESKDVPSVAKAVTLEVTIEQAQKLALASQLGTLTLMLRHTANADAEKVRTVHTRDLSVGEAIQPQPVVAAAEPAKKKTRVVRAAPAKIEDPLSAVRIVRGTEATSYQVQPDIRPLEGSSGPTNLLPPEAWSPGATTGTPAPAPSFVKPAPGATLGDRENGPAPETAPGSPLNLMAPEQKAAIVR
ncbi:MAG: Flp pilus assembly protein CpaB [Kiloniellales bacterium]